MTMADKVLWLVPDGAISSGMKMVVESILRAQGVPTSSLVMQDVRKYMDTSGFTDETVNLAAAANKLIGLVKPKVVVCNDSLVLGLVTNTSSLHNCRGSVYEYRLADSNLIDFIVFDNVNSIFSVMPHGRWLFQNDAQKLARFLKGTTRKQPKFAYKVAHSIHDIAEAKKFLLDCIIIAEDIEAHPGYITCIGFTGWHKDGRVFTYVFPVWNPLHSGGHHFSAVVEEFLWETVKAIHDSQIPKVMQNGAFDSSYFIRYNVPPAAYFLDTMHLWHSIFTEAPKKLNIIASVLLDYVQYWKDETKGDSSESGWSESAQTKRFKSQADMERFWRYNALDNYYTLLSCRILLALHRRLDWARANYKVEFPLQIGPCLDMSMCGLAINPETLANKKAQWRLDHLKALADMRVMADDKEFNPTPAQISHIVYSTLGGTVPSLKGKAGAKEADRQRKAEEKGKVAAKPTDKAILKMVANQHPILEMFIGQIGKVKGPALNISKYTKPEMYYNDRLYFSMAAAGTETGRLACSAHSFDLGTQVQNVPNGARDFVVPDPGEVFFEPDYSQSDARFVAYESEDPTFIYNVECGKDTHCLHAAHFFRPLTYDEIFEKYKAGDPVYADEVTGIRAITKKIVHGKNYNMGGFTLFMLMGKKAAYAAAVAKGFNPNGWDDNRYAKFCQSLLDDYDRMYPELARWKQREFLAGAKNGNKITCAHGRTRLFFGDLAKDGATQREAAAYYGQGGTAGHINDVMLRLYYAPPTRDFANNTRLASQTHDSILFSIKEDYFHQAAEIILTAMREPVIIHGRSLSVPPDGKAGYAWGRGLLKYKPDLTIEKMKAHYASLN